MKKTLLLISLAFLSSSCLKTRNQVRADDESSSERGAPAKIQDVKVNDSYVVDEMKVELTRLTGRIEDLERERRESQGDKSKDETIKKLETRIQELEQTQTTLLENMKKAQDAAKADPKEAFERGEALFNEKKYEEAAKELSTYIKAGGKSIEEATFMRGESYYELKEYKKAIVDFSKFYEKYAKAKKASKAVLRIAQSFDALGMKEDATAFYQEVLDKYPKSKEAATAKKKLGSKKS